MRYQGSAAYQLDNTQRAWETPVRRPLSVHEGGRLSAQANQNSLAARLRAVVFCMVAVVLVAGIRVGVIAATVQCLSDVNETQVVVDEARETRTELRVERSALSSADRIQRIATQNYGMVYASDVDTITLREDAPSTASADDAQIAEGESTEQPMA